MKKLRSKLIHFSNSVNTGERFSAPYAMGAVFSDELPKPSIYEIELEIQNKHLSDIKEKLDVALNEYAELFELSPVSYFILNESGVIENVNARGSAQLGRDKTDLIGRQFSEFLNEADQDIFEFHKIEAIAEGRLERLECNVKKKTGSFFSALVKLKVVLDAQFQFKHMLLMMIDVSTIKEHERQMESQLTKLKELNALKSSFIGMASHEFRTPLTAMLSGTALIERYAELGEMDKIHKHTGRIKLSIHRLVTILNEFLSIEKLESGKVEVKKANLNLKDLCESLIEEIGATKKKGQKIYYLHEGTQETHQDENILQYILLNLLSNACKYSDEGGEIKLFTQISDHQIMMQVVDRGIGIPEAEQSRIFSSFFRAGNTGDIEGTGLGLNIVKRYVDLLGGSVSFCSEPDKGTTFIVKLPQS